MKKAECQSLGRFTKTIIICLLGVTVLNIIWVLGGKPLFILNENQLLYLFSSMAQIIGGVFGLTLTAYVFFVDKFKESTQGDDTYYDATLAILRRFFQTLVTIAISCGLTILLCILGITALHNWTTVYPFIINQCVLLFVLSLISVLTFGGMLLDPDKLDKEVKRQLHHVAANTVTDKAGDFTEFLKYYNLLQEVIINFAKSLVYNKEVNIFEFRQYKPQIIQSLRVLAIKEVINGTLREEIDNLRMYRNGLVHGINFSISQSVIDRVVKIYKAIENAHEAYKANPRGGEKWDDAIRQIYDLTQSDNVK